MVDVLKLKITLTFKEDSASVVRPNIAALASATNRGNQEVEVASVTSFDFNTLVELLALLYIIVLMESFAEVFPHCLTVLIIRFVKHLSKKVEEEVRGHKFPEIIKVASTQTELHNRDQQSSNC